METAPAVRRKILIGANWKCHGSLAYLKEMINTMINKVSFDQEALDVFIAPPFVHIHAAKVLLTTHILLGAQNVSGFPKGSYTGDVNAEILRDFGISYVIIGHSERRFEFQETEEKLFAKIDEAHKNNMNVVLCIGEKPEEHESGNTWTSIQKQLTFFHEKKVDWRRISIAYEPFWALMMKKTITIEQVQDICEQTRKWFRETVSPEIADSMRLLFAGTVNESSCKVFMMQKDIDGFLLGSKESTKNLFCNIIKICNEAKVAALAVEKEAKEVKKEGKKDAKKEVKK